MNNNELEQTIIKALDDNKFGSFGTIEAGNKPKVRYMAVFHDGLNIYLATNRKTHKVEELKDNPNAFLLLGYEQGGGKDVLEIEATVDVSKDDSLRTKVWSKSLEEWFKGPEDPDYVVLELKPTRIEYMGKNKEHGVWQPSVSAGR
ncbi:general stress protein [Paenibacillus sp. FSL R7-0273]|uniref:pyridoxamine 5'-phosphate oxidase family protein n=1 Tax=Paenibacillus sp. FSL R7-0273 TaxID=1536772 RepID=UPI0004F7022C|nr:pyridoxamine 5'-phosphate oxidase family protein [Paenibacillus sp. FSL R7-0273]AIQ44783.1 general stress protein [Paenibacillus sp. FSL R7-0273]OMF93354.1 general stress protein [Paenibacillus sp. FSL R7-0273]